MGCKMKTNLSKWFSIRKAGKNGLGIKLKKQKQDHDLANSELINAHIDHCDFHNRIDKLRINESISEWKIKGIKWE